MDNTQLLITVVLGLIAQPIIGLLKDIRWSTTAKTALAAVISLVLGTIAVYATGGLSATNITTSATVVFTVANLVYNFLLKGSGINTAIERINIFGPDTSRQEVADREAHFEPSTAVMLLDKAIHTDTPEEMTEMLEKSTKKVRKPRKKALDNVEL